MGFREDFEKFKNPEKKEESKVLLPSFEAVRTALREVKKQPEVKTTPIQDRNQRALDIIERDRNNGVSISAPTGYKQPVPDDFDFLKNKSEEKQQFKLSDLIIPEVRKGFNQAFGDSEKGTASDIYTEMIPSFGKKRAEEIAYAYQNGVDAFGYPAGIKLTEAEKTQFDAWKHKHWAMLTLDASDFLGVGIAIKGGMKYFGRMGLRNAMTEASTLTNVKDIHAAVLKQLPEIKGTQELDDITDIIIASREQNPDKLAQIVQKRVQNSDLAPRASLATDVQRVVYENGVPVLRQSTPTSLLTRRAEALEALKGNREALRLSNADILADEIRAGILKTTTTADDTIDVWRVAPKGRRVRTGEEISLVEDFANALSELAKPQKIEIKLADLVRLPDGTYTYAPERLIKESPKLAYPKNVAKEVVDTAKKIESDKVARKLAKEKAEQEAKRVALEKAEKELMKPVEQAKARMKLLQEKPALIRSQTQNKISQERKLVAREIISTKKTTKNSISTIDKTLRTAKQEASLEHVKRMEKAKTKLQKQKEKIRYQNKLAKLTEKAKKEKAELKLSEKETISDIKSKSNKRISETRKKGSSELKEANKALRGAKGEANAIIKKGGETLEKTSVTKTVQTETKLPKTTKRSKESLKPVGEGAIQESKLYESTQTRVREIRKDLGETINSKEFEFYRKATNKDQLEKASRYIIENGVDKTVKELEVALRTGGDAVDGVLNNSLLIALEPELMKAGMAKHAESLLRLSSRLSTRFGQEIQILSVLDRNNPLVVLQRLQSNIDNLVSESKVAGVTINQGARAKAEKAIEELVKKVDLKEEAKQALGEIKICKT